MIELLPRTERPAGTWEQLDLPFPGATMAVVVTTDGEALTGLRFGTPDDDAGWGEGEPRTPRPLPGPRSGSGVLSAAADQLWAYAAGELTEFDLPLRLYGTPFQTSVWSALLDVPYGRTVSYGWLASAAGRPGSARAVGAAVGANPIGIVVPCHRVIGADGALTGFGGGLDNKAVLLAREGVAAL